MISRTYVVASIVNLRRLERLGHITLHEQTGTKVKTPFGATVTACYIDDYTKERVFTVDNVRYEVKYQSGCFHPFVYATILGFISVVDGIRIFNKY